MKLRIFTDGACSDNPGPGGWGVVFCMADSYKTYSGYELETTNNRMELRAVIEALKAVDEQKYELDADGYDQLELYSDSAYVINAINNNWIKNWRANGWQTKRGDDVKNVDLWKDVDRLLSSLTVRFVKIKGHAGNTFNELVDKLAKDESVKARALLGK